MLRRGIGIGALVLKPDHRGMDDVPGVGGSSIAVLVGQAQLCDAEVPTVGGALTPLAAEAAPDEAERAHEVAVRTQRTQRTQRSQRQVLIDGAVAFTVSDGALAGGSIALYNWANAGSSYDDAAVLSVSP